MENNSLMKIILSTNLDSKLLNYFSLYEKLEKTNLNESLIDNLKTNIIRQLYDIINPVFVEQYNMAVQNRSITGITFKERIKEFEEIINSERYIPDLFSNYPVLENIIFSTLNDYLDSINEIIANYIIQKENLDEYFTNSFGDILRISMDLGDKHNGRSVAKIDFENGVLILIRQTTISECGLCCISMVSSYYGYKKPLCSFLI